MHESAPVIPASISREKASRKKELKKKKDQTLFTASNFSWETGCVNQTSDDKIDEFHTGMASLSKKYRRFKLTSQHSLLSSDTVHRVLDHNDNACWFFSFRYSKACVAGTIAQLRETFCSSSCSTLMKCLGTQALLRNVPNTGYGTILLKMNCCYVLLLGCGTSSNL